jgi:O-antigen/teichoic acid export membrane protein
VGVSDFGIYAFVLQLTSYLAILQLSLDFAASQRIGESLGRHDLPAASNTFRHVVRFNHYVAVAVACAAMAIAFALYEAVGIESLSARRLAVAVALLTGGAQVMAFLSRPFAAALIGSKRQNVVNLIVIGNTISTSLLAYLFLRLGLGILCIPVASFILVAMSVFVYRQQARRRCKFLEVEPADSSGQTFRSLLSFGGLASVGGIAWTIEATSDVMILGALAGPSAVAIYVLWWRFPSMLFDLCTRLSTSAFPVFAERHGQSVQEARQLLGKVGQLTIGLATAALIGLTFWLPNFMSLWLGDNFRLSNGSTIAFAMGALVCLRTLGNLAGMFWLASGQAHAPTAVALIQAAVKLGLALVLAKAYGMLGLIIASCAASSLQVIILGALLYGRKLLSERLLLSGGVMVVLGTVLSLLGRELNLSLQLSRFILGVMITIVLWSGIWLILSWRTELKTNLARLLKPLESQA